MSYSLKNLSKRDLTSTCQLFFRKTMLESFNNIVRIFFLISCCYIYVNLLVLFFLKVWKFTKLVIMSFSVYMYKPIHTPLYSRDIFLKSRNIFVLEKLSKSLGKPSKKKDFLCLLCNRHLKLIFVVCF